jgi:hypothetical protein
MTPRLARARTDAPVRGTKVMTRKRMSRNAPCPCGSGRKYKHCCIGKGFEWQQDEEGGVYRAMPLSDEMKTILEEQRRRFIEKYGREPGPDDPIFFDLPPLEHVEHQVVQAMKAAGLDPAYVHAYEKTGLLVTEQNQHLIPEKDLDEWDAAVREYEAGHGTSRAPKQGAQPRGQPRYPVGTVAFYGPDDKTTTKVAAAVIRHEGAEPVLKRWVGAGVATNPRVERELREFFEGHGVRSVGMSEGNLGCPHEEGEDFPAGEDCPSCPFWKGKQGSSRRD